MWSLQVNYKPVTSAAPLKRGMILILSSLMCIRHLKGVAINFDYDQYINDVATGEFKVIISDMIVGVLFQQRCEHTISSSGAVFLRFRQ